MKCDRIFQLQHVLQFSFITNTQLYAPATTHYSATLKHYFPPHHHSCHSYHTITVTSPLSSLLGEDDELDFSGSSDVDSGSGSVLYDEGFEDGPVKRGFGEDEGEEEEGEGEKSLSFC